MFSGCFSGSCSSVFKVDFEKLFPAKDHSFSTFAKFSEKLTFLTPLIGTLICVYQGVRDVSFSENFA